MQPELQREIETELEEDVTTDELLATCRDWEVALSIYLARTRVLENVDFVQQRREEVGSIVESLRDSIRSLENLVT